MTFIVFPDGLKIRDIDDEFVLEIFQRSLEINCKQKIVELAQNQ